MTSKAEIKRQYQFAQDYSDMLNALGLVWDRCNGCKVSDFMDQVLIIVGVTEYKRVAESIAQDIITSAVVNFGLTKASTGIVDLADKYICKTFAEINK